MIEEYVRQGPEYTTWGGTLIEKSARVAIGQMGFMGMPDADGMVEIGYGINRSYEGRGYATEMVRALVEWALNHPEVRGVRAECSVDNPGSIRVLEKSDFIRTGTRVDDEDGPLIMWERR
jgi:[ribosomal protein S5]-alanine N-acetyltransferase